MSRSLMASNTFSCESNWYERSGVIGGFSSSGPPTFGKERKSLKLWYLAPGSMVSLSLMQSFFLMKSSMSAGMSLS